MRLLLDIIKVALFVMLLPMLPAFWLMCRFQAKPCPRCGSKWRTELRGEWDCEMWKCHACEHYWETPANG